MRSWVRYQGNVTEIKSQSFLVLRTISKNIAHKRHTQKAINHGSMPPLTRTKQQLLVSTAAACGCCWCIRAGLSPGWCPRSPFSTTARSPTLSTAHDGKHLASNAPPPLPLQQVAPPLLQQPPHKQTAKENSEIVHFLCHHLLQLSHLFAQRLLISLLPQWPNLPTEISRPPGKILNNQCLPLLWMLWKSVEIVQFFI